MKKRNIRYEKNTDGDFSAVDGWTFSKQKCEEHQKGNRLQQSPLLKWELVRLGQQPPSNRLQQSPQAKGELVRWDQQAPNNHAQQSPQAKGELVRWGQQSPNNRPQQLPQAKGELRRWGQQLPNNYLQQLPQAKGELPGDCWESVFGKISEESSLETRVEQLPGNSPLAWGNCWG